MTSPVEGREVDLFLDAAAAHAEADLATPRPRPPFAAVLARAHALDPAAVPASWLDAHALKNSPASAGASPVPADSQGSADAAVDPVSLDIRSPARPPAATARTDAPADKDARQAPPRSSVLADSRAREAAALTPFVAAARALAERDADERRLAPVPPLQRPRRLAPSLFALAAAVLLCVTGLAVVRELAVFRDDPARAAQADATVHPSSDARQVRPGEPGRQASPRFQAPVPKDIPPAIETPVPGVTPAIEAPVPRDPPPALETPVPRDSPPPAASPASRDKPSLAASPVPKDSLRSPKPLIESLAEQLRRLDDEAEALLLAGAHAEADARYREIIAIGGRRPAVELAHADRWMLARSTGDRAAQVALWRAYLERFPRGRFADEATAGLCRAAEPDARPACWRAYLDEFPAGAYRREAGAQGDVP